MDTSDVDDVYNCDEVARLLRVSRRHVLNLARDNLLPGAFRLGKVWRFNGPAIRQLIKEGRSCHGSASAEASIGGKTSGATTIGTTTQVGRKYAELLGLS